MDSLPLIPKLSIFPNLDVSPLIRELFQAEFESHVPSKKLSENIRKGLEFETTEEDLGEEIKFKSITFLENLPNEKNKLLSYAKNIYEAYEKHKEALEGIAKVELNIIENQALYLKREQIISENSYIQDLLKLKRHPLMKSCDSGLVKKYRLLQGEAGLPPKHEAFLDFRMKNFQKWKKRLHSISNDSLIMNFKNKTCSKRQEMKPTKKLMTENAGLIKAGKQSQPKEIKITQDKKSTEIFRADPTMVCFTEYSPGKTYQCRVKVQNVHTKPIRFLLKPPPIGSPFKIRITDLNTHRILPGFSFKILVTFTPRNMDDVSDSIILVIEDGSQMIIPVISYLEPPILKTHEDMAEFTNNFSKRILNNYIDCGSCLSGDSKITKIRFYSCGGTGEFFIMKLENWSSWHIDSLTPDNFTEIPPFRLYPTYFKIEKNQVIDLYIEFTPLTSGLHSDNMILACDNGEIMNLDILGDGISWNRSFFSFEDTLEKDFPPCISDDHKAVYYLNLGDSLSTGMLSREFTISNNSNMHFDFCWEMRDIIIPFEIEEKFMKFYGKEVKIEPSSGTFEPGRVLSFRVSAAIDKKPIGKYRTVLSLYVIGLPYHSIEQATTVVRPSTMRGRFKSGNFLQEDDLSASVEIPYQDEYENVRESMKTSLKMKYQQLPSTVCENHPNLNAPLPGETKTFDGNGNFTFGEAKTDIELVKNQIFNCHIIHLRKEKPNITELGSDLPWDFVDVLVDEIELWVQVIPTAVAIEPNIVNLNTAVMLNEPAIKYEVNIRNYSKFPVKCKWFKSKSKMNEKVLNNSRPAYEKISREEEEEDTFFGNGKGSNDGKLCKLSSESFTFVDTSRFCQVTNFAAQNINLNMGVKMIFNNDNCKFKFEPKDEFVVPAASYYLSTIFISAKKPGVLDKVLHLNVNDGDVQLKLHVIGMVLERKFAVTPSFIDFGPVKQGAMHKKYFKIRNDSKIPLEWEVKQFRYDFENKTFVGPIEKNFQSNLKRYEGNIFGEGCCDIECYRLDARKPGLQCTLLKFDLSRPAFKGTFSNYVLVLGDVQTPELAIQAPRFNTAILAPSRTMYVGKMIVKNIILRNTKSISTNFIWGNAFGCHCRRLSTKMYPQRCVIDAKKKMVIQVKIMPLQEGIIDHCYIPCFFSRNAKPALLSIIGIVKNLEVSFEIPKEKVIICENISKDAFKSGKEEISFKISWPIRNFDPNIGISHIFEDEILNFVCHCNKVEEEYLKWLKSDIKSMGKILTKDNDDSNGKDFDNNCVAAIAAESKRYGEDVLDKFYSHKKEKSQSERSYEGEQYLRKYRTQNRISEFGTSVLEKNTITEMIDFDKEKEKGEDKNSKIGDTRNTLPLCDSSLGIDSKGSMITEYPESNNFINLLYYISSELRFFKVVPKTVAARHFIIRNLTPIKIAFSLKVRYFGKVNREDQEDWKKKLIQIKNRVNGRFTREYDSNLSYGQPLVIMVSPSDGCLKPWNAVRVSVFVYGNTWGEYRDYIICNLCGMPPFLMKVFVQLSGHPLQFPMFNTSTKSIPILRYNTVKYHTAPVVRNIRIRNTSSIPITITWMVFLMSSQTEDLKEEPFKLCLDLYTDKEGADSEKVTKSSYNYASKNTSENIQMKYVMDVDKTSSQFIGLKLMSEKNSWMKKNPCQMKCCNNGTKNDVTVPTDKDSTKLEIQLLENFGKMDLNVFQINPREIDLEPISEKKISITFNPNRYEQNVHVLDYDAVVTGCVRLKQEHANYPDIYLRPCGKDYVSKLLLLSASVEKPLLHFDIFKKDMEFALNANDMIKTEKEHFGISKKFIIKNNNQTSINTKVKIHPGKVFAIKRIVTFDKIFVKFNSECHTINIEPGNAAEVEVEVLINSSQLIEFYRKFKFGQPSSSNHFPIREKSSEIIMEGVVLSNSNMPSIDGTKPEDDTTEQNFAAAGESSADSILNRSQQTFSILSRDSLFTEPKTKNLSTPVRSGVTTRNDSCLKMKAPALRIDASEGHGEISLHDIIDENKGKQPSNFEYVVKENLVFEQVGQHIQVITPELHVYFPALKISPNYLDFGNVYIGETARRCAAIINLTQFPTDYRVSPIHPGEEFRAFPDRAQLPATNYKSDTGKDIIVEFTPKKPGYLKKTFAIFGNLKMMFDSHSLTVCGSGTWNEKDKYPKSETHTKNFPLFP